MNQFNSWKRRLFRFCSGIVVLVGLLQTAAAADFLGIYRLAQGNDPTFAAARHAREAVEQRLPQAWANFLPTISATSADNRTLANTSFNYATPIDRTVRTWNWNVQMTHPLFHVQNYYAYIEAAATVEQAVAQYMQAEQDLILRAAQAYFDVVVAEDSIVVAEAKLKAMSEQQAIAARGFQFGTTALTDVHEARARVDLARSELVAARNERVAKRAELEKVIGESPRTLSALRPQIVAPRPQPDDEQAWVGQARENNPVVRAGQAALAATDSVVSKHRAEHLPTLDFTTTLGRNYSSGIYSMPTDYTTLGRTMTTGIQVTIPIFSGGGTSARVAEAIANRRKAEADLEAARRQAATDARQAFAGIASGLAQMEALASAIESGEVAVTGNQAGYRVGIRINSDVLNAEQQLYASKRDLTKARYDTLMQGLKLKAAAGALSEEDVLVINALLGPRFTDLGAGE
ncbi:TolC family outer membrane protein [Propionivibrio dicarboxylicus]|uniref:Outer membrane protein n=1 Tax=Propionivibrio dicarboxylicus TaxID=83767 RepID=A0A1G8MGZ3_9RHOO|nr:TolC family outer membrane protein [Propionivibrio dicarboxylicus]SDI66620.1 outer membrane protein [Propionivibrio dicarboxylicus]